MLIVFFRAIILYVIIVFSMRLMGKRQLGELQPSELVVTVLMSNIATLPVEDINIPMIMGVVPIFTLVCLDVILSHLSLKFRGLRKVMCGSPKIAISEGVVDQQVLKDLRFSVDDLMEGLRSQQVFDISQVQLAVVETTGKISVFQKQEFSPAANSDMGIKVENSDPPQIVVDNGKIIDNALSFLHLEKKDILRKLKSCNKKLEDVFIMTCSAKGEYTVIENQPVQKRNKKK